MPINDKHPAEIPSPTSTSEEKLLGTCCPANRFCCQSPAWRKVAKTVHPLRSADLTLSSNSMRSTGTRLLDLRFASATMVPSRDVPFSLTKSHGSVMLTSTRRPRNA